MDVQEQLRQDKVRALLSAAQLSNRRLEWKDALEKCQAALALDHQSAEAHELVGDVLQAMGNWDGALQSYKTAQKLNPSRTVLEEKIGLVSIELDQVALREARREQLIADPSQLKWEERDPKVACILSAILPGLGQFYNGEHVKALMVFAITVISAVILYLGLQGVLDAAATQSSLKGKMNAMTQAMQSWSIPQLLWMLLNCFVPLGMWLFSIIEAPLRAKRINQAMRAELGLE
jgi:tetratricopeptide (TPR) repeat protein